MHRRIVKRVYIGRNEGMKKVLKIVLSIIAIFIVIAIVMGGCIGSKLKKVTTRPKISENPTVGEWYRITPKQAVNSDGTQWHGLFRKGSENKVVVYFYGGGVSTDKYMAARPEGKSDEGFYNPAVTNDGLEMMGLGSTDKKNPFRNWTMLVIPYSTADWHCGSGEFEYTDLNGSTKTLYHHGYTNFNFYMQEAMKYIDTPDEVLITGFSGGGFGAALLGNDTITNYFPTVKNTTVFAEASFLLDDDWNNIAKNVWHAPDQITDRLVSNNITLDSLKALAKDHPNTKILFSSSVRDNALSKYQNYYSNSIMKATNEAGDVYQKNLKEMVRSLQKIPNTGVLIWEGYNDQKGTNLTGHTLMFMPYFYADDLNGTTMVNWVMSAVNGDVEDHGLELLDKEY
jgi:hypothetical protein